jgi:hypothetical protein
MDARRATNKSTSKKRDIAEVRMAKGILKIRIKHAFYATGVFALSCAIVWPFLAEGPLGAYWKTVGRNLIFLPAALLLPFVILVGRAINAWFFVREVKRIER